MGDVYSANSYGERGIGFGAKLGILVVDFQRGFIDPQFQQGGSPRVDSAVERTAALLRIARARGVPVASCYTAYPSEDGMPYWKVGAVRRELIEGRPAVELDPRIEDRSYDYIFQKWGASAFFQTSCSAYFTKHRVDTVAVTGCVTSGCVRASAVDAFQFGFRTMLVDDCCGDIDEQPHLDTLRDVGRRYADIVTADDVERVIMQNEKVT